MADTLGTPPLDGGGTPPPVDTGTLGTPPPTPPAGDAPAKGDGGTPPPGDKGTPPAKTPPPKVPTIGDELPKDPKGDTPPAPADWPEDWRAKMAGDNKKAFERLEKRFKSPKEVHDSYLALEQMVSGKGFVKKLPTHYTEAELAEYRKENSIPDKPEDYNVDIPGLVWGDADKPMLDSWKHFAHENNLSPEIAKLGPAWYAREQEQIVNRLAEEDMHRYQTGTDALRAEWGKEFQGNINAARNMFEAVPGMWEMVMSARGPDGAKLGDTPAVLKWAAAEARERNPFATILPASGGNDPVKSVETRMGEIKQLMGDKGSAYWKGPQRDQLQQEYRDLIDLRERAASRGRAA